MLRFHGIRFNQAGAPERFSISFALNDSLYAGLQICAEFSNDLKDSIKAVDKEIANLFQGPDSSKNNKKFRFLIAKWFRTKDIVNFLLGDAATKELKTSIAAILSSRDEIFGKWQEIEPLMLDYMVNLSIEARNHQLSDSESDINQILQMISLFFLEQDDEVPPANLELQFIRHQFPKIIWKKKDGFNAACNPFWLPKNLYCRPSYLLARLISKIYEQAENSGLGKTVTDVLVPESMVVEDSADDSGSDQLSFSLNSLLPEGEPSEIKLEFEDDEEEENKQLQLIPESVAETLLSLQKRVQKRFSHDGVKHLLGIIRQLAGSTKDGYCLFSVRKHLELVAKPSKKGVFSDKQVSLFKEVFKLISKVRVKRLWKSDKKTRTTENPFILELYSETKEQNEAAQKIKVLLDPLFLPSKSNPFHLGVHLRLIPPRLFRESIYKHPLLPGLASYLTGTWLNEYNANQGVAKKSIRNVIEGCAFNVVPSNKFRIIDKVKSELAYMKEKCYISEYNSENNEQGNPWDDIFTITASENVLTSIAERMRAVNANSVSEKLIA